MLRKGQANFAEFGNNLGFAEKLVLGVQQVFVSNPPRAPTPGS